MRRKEVVIMLIQGLSAHNKVHRAHLYRKLERQLVAMLADQQPDAPVQPVLPPKRPRLGLRGGGLGV